MAAELSLEAATNGGAVKPRNARQGLPVVAAPGYTLYYLWVMAGQGRALAPYLDPWHAWIQTAEQ